MANKILLADDSVTVQKIITLTFKDEHVDVETVNNGDEALNKLQYLRPSLVMADVSIPGKDGYQICEYVKNHHELSHIPVVLLVPAFEPFDAERARQAGADTYLTKPFQSIKALITTVKNLIESPDEPISMGSIEVSPDETIEEDEPDNVVDMTSRIAAVREEPNEIDTVTAEGHLSAAGYKTADILAADDEDHVLDLDDVLGEAWESQPLEPVVEPEPESQPPAEMTATLTQAQIDEIVDRVVARLTDSLIQKLVPALTDEIVARITPEIAERTYETPDERQLSFHDPDALLEIDEI